MSNRDKLRSLTLGGNTHLKREEITIAGEKFEIRQPTLKERSEFRKKAMTIGADDKGKGKVDFDIYEFQFQAVIKLVVVPGTDEPVFAEEDRDAIESMPAGGWFDELSEKVNELCNVSDDKAKKA